MPNPIDDPDLYDFAIVNGTISPPIDKDGIEGFGVVNKLDKKEPDGASGGITTFKGQKQGEGSLRFIMYTADHFADWDAIAPELQTKKDAKEAITILHQDLIDQGYTTFLVEEIGARQGGWGGEPSTRTIKLSQFAPPKPASGTPAKAKDASGVDIVTGASSVADQTDALIESLITEANKP